MKKWNISPGRRAPHGLSRVVRALLYQKVLKVGKEREIPENSDVIGFPKGIAKIDALPAAASDYNYAGTEFGARSLSRLSVCSYKLN